MSASGQDAVFPAVSLYGRSGNVVGSGISGDRGWLKNKPLDIDKPARTSFDENGKKLLSSKPNPTVNIMVEYRPEGAEKQDKKREELYAKVLNLKDIVSYQDGTVASRMLVNKKAGSITIFSFDENEGLSEHVAPYDAVLTVIDGECEVWIAGHTFPMKEGETIILPANVPHALSAITKFKMVLSMIRE